MVYAFSGGTDKPTADIKGIPEIVEPSGFNFRSIGLADLSVLTDPNAGPIGEYYKSGFRVKAANLPKVVRIIDPRHLVDLDSDGALTYASARARDLIERLEPGMHQFEPVVFVDYDRKKLADMFVFFVCRRLDTVDREHTNMILSPHYWRPARDVFRRKPELVPLDADLEAEPNQVFSLSRIGGAHIWRDKHIADSMYVSDAFVETFYEEGLTGLAKVKQASVAWRASTPLKQCPLPLSPIPCRRRSSMERPVVLSESGWLAAIELRRDRVTKRQTSLRPLDQISW